MTAHPNEIAAMRRALAVAANGPRGFNPQVGAVILSPAGDVLAEGWHRGSGTAHAEVDALSKLRPEQTRGATAVVSLEPCNHTGRTGPCAQALIDAGISRVVYAVDDPGDDSSHGADRLRAAGVDVVSGVLGDQAREVIDSWLAVQRLGRPHVTVKWAQSLDGRVAAADGTSQWITGPASRADVHRRRALADAIVAGTGTVLADDPALTARTPEGDLLPDQPTPVVIGEREVPEGALLRRHPKPFEQYSGRDLPGVLAHLRQAGVQRVFVEGGPTLASAFIRAGLVDEILTYVAPVLLGSGESGDHPAIGAIGVDTIGAAPRLALQSVERLGDDILLVSTPVPIPSPAR
ncbi:bifunctional diaminohydroxyphosphoribosylaminopyrimidine deaminase/5-amino-6-(5-phosphoribosylamino)uracil reductase RibD [Microbacterium sediminicola]|uniref:Riboflavin biosynthesis protein RibD n=1 Tax=Microbacterium sediminicola TaxID=415210 RepID=A0ABN2HKP5_9MICO